MSMWASMWPNWLATAPGLPSTSSIEEGHAPAPGQIGGTRIRRAFFTKERMLSQAECERPVTRRTSRSIGRIEAGEIGPHVQETRVFHTVRSVNAVVEWGVLKEKKRCGVLYKLRD